MLYTVSFLNQIVILDADSHIVNVVEDACRPFYTFSHNVASSSSEASQATLPIRLKVLESL